MKTTVKLNEENPEPIEIIAYSIIKISETLDKIKTSRLNEKALIILIHSNCGMTGGRFNKKKVSMKQVKEVLDSIATLKKEYIKTIPVKKK